MVAKGKNKSQKKKHQESAAVNAMFTITNILIVEKIKTKRLLFSKGFKKEKLPFI